MAVTAATLSAILGAVGLAIGAGTSAYSIYASERANDQQEKLTQEQKELQEKQLEQQKAAIGAMSPFPIG